MTTGQKIAAARNKADMTQAQLAKKMYVQVSVIRDIETGYILIFLSEEGTLWKS